MVADDEIIREFLIESSENLNLLDSEIVNLEKHPTPERLGNIFRTIHTIKGTCGFLGFHSLENITHHAEDILGQLRTGQRPVNSGVVSLILQSIDAVRQILSNIEATGEEGVDRFPELLQSLARATSGKDYVRGSTQLAPQSEKPTRMADSSLRVDVKLLDKLLNLAGELVLVRNQILEPDTQYRHGALNHGSSV